MRTTITSLIISIICFVSCTPANEKVFHNTSTEEFTLDGRWEVVESSFDYFDHPSTCNGLGIGTIFKFQDSTLQIFKDGTEFNCSQYPQTFSYDSSEISILEIDMLFHYNIVNIRPNELTLNSKIIVPRSLYTRHYSMDDTGLESTLSRNGITIKLKRI
jgi:hypothetical protein